MADDLDGPSFVWQIGAEHIDLDHWARTYVAVRVEEKAAPRSTFVRYGFWPIAALVVLAFGLTSSPTSAGVMAAAVAVPYIGARLWNRGAATRLAKPLRALPAAGLRSDVPASVKVDQMARWINTAHAASVTG